MPAEPQLGVVAAGHPVTARIGADVLRGGGKQIDPRMVAHWDQRSGYFQEHGADVDLEGETFALVESMVNRDLKTSAPAT